MKFLQFVKNIFASNGLATRKNTNLQCSRDKKWDALCLFEEHHDCVGVSSLNGFTKRFKPRSVVCSRFSIDDFSWPIDIFYEGSSCGL